MPGAEVLTYEKVWEMFKETDKKFKKTDRKFQKTREQILKETDRLDRKIRKELEETAQIVKELSKNIGGLNNSMGALIETLIAARLWEKFGIYNLCLAYRRVPNKTHGMDTGLSSCRNKG